ncbi:putative dimethylaniline monooxygenase [Fusarium oxysporum]|nr:putative dimethylaniline monooxygenase [Fusarium oxysporum]
MFESYDLVVIGSGWFGLGASKAYIETHPDEKVAILEANDSVGGTWSANRLYPGLKSNNMIGTYEFPDFPMSKDIYGVEENDHIPGKTLHKYLTDYARKHGVLERTQFNSTVSQVEQTSEDGWKLTVASPQGERQIGAKRIVVATGLTSTPNMPYFEGSESFGKPLFHAKEFCSRADEVKGVKNAIVVGGAKSAYDVAYAMVDAGAQVDLIVKPETNGPVWIAPRWVTPVKARIDKTLTVRFMTWFAPCPWGHEDGFGAIRRFLHGTAFGRMIVRAFWRSMGNDVLNQINYDNHPETKKLKPWYDVFWIGSGLSILNFNKDFFDLVRDGRIRVHIDNVKRLEPGQVLLESGKRLKADSMICSTGWKKESLVKFSNLGEHAFGLPYGPKEQAQLNSEFDARVKKHFPQLKQQPKLRSPPRPYAEPLRNYRFIVPPAFLGKRNIAFAGMISSVTTAVCASMQGVWISAYFDNKLVRESKSQEDITNEVMMHTQWGKWRYPAGYGASLPDFVFEGVPYVDMLLKDLGIRNRRKPSFYAELTSPYTPQDYNGVMDEYKERTQAT